MRVRLPVFILIGAFATRRLKAPGVAIIASAIYWISRMLEFLAVGREQIQFLPAALI